VPTTGWPARSSRTTDRGSAAGSSRSDRLAGSFAWFAASRPASGRSDGRFPILGGATLGARTDRSCESARLSGPSASCRSERRPISRAGCNPVRALQRPRSGNAGNGVKNKEDDSDAEVRCFARCRLRLGNRSHLACGTEDHQHIASDRRRHRRRVLHPERRKDPDPRPGRDVSERRLSDHHQLSELQRRSASGGGPALSSPTISPTTSPFSAPRRRPAAPRTSAGTSSFAPSRVGSA
jgi:hypothetical protein